MTLQVGKYHFGRHYNRWGIWQCLFVSDSSTSSKHVKDVYSYEEAVKETYRLNGWGEPKNVRRKY